jgi:hypothetical protein
MGIDGTSLNEDTLKHTGKIIIKAHLDHFLGDLRSHLVALDALVVADTANLHWEIANSISTLRLHQRAVRIPGKWKI